MEQDCLHLEISQFVHFMVQILFHKSNGVQSVSSFKILNDVVVCILLDLKYLIQTMKWRLPISFQMKRILVQIKYLRSNNIQGMRSSPFEMKWKESISQSKLNIIDLTVYILPILNDVALCVYYKKIGLRQQNIFVAQKSQFRCLMYQATKQYIRRQKSFRRLMLVAKQSWR